jgi:FkbM family methyltransferase
LTDWKFLFEKYALRKHRPKTGVYGTEPLVAREIKLFRGNVALDVGAGTGEYTLVMAKKFRSVFAFEPNPERARELRARLKRSDARNVTVIEAAVAERKGSTILWLDPPAKRPGGPASTIVSTFDYKPASQELEQHAERFEGRTGIPVTTLSLSDLSLPGPVDLMKVDVEGAEFQVLSGATSMMEMHEIHNLILELHNRDEKSKIETLMKNYGYSFRWLDPDHLLATSVQKAGLVDSHS